MKTKMNKAGLARALGVTRKTLYEWKRKGAPVEDPEALARWMNEHEGALLSRAGTDAEMRTLLKERLRLQVDRMRHELGVAEGRYIEVGPLAVELGQAVEMFKQSLLALPAQLAAPFGAIGPEIEAHADRVIREGLTRLSAEFQPTKQ